MRFFKRNKQHKHDNRMLYQFTWKGVHYFKLPEDVFIGIDRLGVLEEYKMWIGQGMSNKMFEDYLTAIEQADFEYKTAEEKKKQPGKVPAIIHDMRQHKGRIAVADVYYNYLAVFYFRQDEVVKGFSQVIQEEKANAFKEAASQQDSFFFRLPELGKLLGFTNFTSEKWQELVKLSNLLESRHQEKMQYYSGKK